MEILLRYKTLILRILGSFLLLFSLLIQFWDNTKEYTTPNNQDNFLKFLIHL